MTRDTSSPPPTEVCATCSTRRGWRTWTTWARVLVPVFIGLLVTLGAGWLVLRSTAEANAAEVRHLREARSEDRDETKRIASQIAEAQRQAAIDRAASDEHWREVSAALARIEGRLDAERPRTPRRDR